MTLSRSSIHGARFANQKITADAVKTSFRPEGPLTVHWDSKPLPDLTRQEKGDRLPIIFTGINTDQLLDVPKFVSGMGQAQADAVVASLDEWYISRNVKGLCFDTTPSNTSRFNGACILIERALGKSLLYFACHHHTLEIVQEKVFHALHNYNNLFWTRY